MTAITKTEVTESELSRPDANATVFERISFVIATMEGVGKLQKNSAPGQGGYSYRGIEDITKMLRPLFGRAGIFFLPRVNLREVSTVPTKSGGSQQVCELEVEWTIYGIKGDYVTCTTWGEAADVSDKATNKAMTAAYKYALLQVFCISDPDDDADKVTPAERAPRPYAQKPEVAPASSGKPGGPSESQKKLIGTLMEEVGVSRETRAMYAGFCIDRKIESIGDISQGEAQKVITQLMADKKKNKEMAAAKTAPEPAPAMRVNDPEYNDDDVEF